MNIEKRSCIERARALAADSDPALLRYACLELRYCIECIAYEKLRLYAKDIPASVLDAWQPRRVIETLEEYDPLSNQSYTLRIWSETPEGARDRLVFSGEHRTLSPAILRKHYNKLGNYLHVPTPAQLHKEKIETDADLINYLTGLIAALEPVCEKTFDTNLASVVNFACQECGQPIVRNRTSLEKNSTVTCLAENCQARHEACNEEGNWFIRLSQAEFECPECRTKNYMALYRMAEGARIKCVHCRTEYVVDRQWVCVRATPEAGKPNE